MRSFFNSKLFAVIAVLSSIAFGVFAGWKVGFGAYLAFNAAALGASGQFSYSSGVSSFTSLSDLWVPAIWQQGMMEAVVQNPAFLTSGVVATSPLMTQIASGPGTAANLPFLIEPNPSDQIQTENTAPDVQKMGSALQAAAILNRVSPLGSTALAKQISGADPVRAVLGALVRIRNRQRNTAVQAAFSGVFDLTSAPTAGTGAFKALRSDQFSETGASPSSSYLIDSDMLLDTLALLGENKTKMTGGAVLMHSVIENSLLKQGEIDVIRNYLGDIVLRSWKGMTVYVSDKLTRAGGTSGSVYYTFICLPGSIAFGEQPQVVTMLPGDVAALQLDMTQIAANNVVIYDRTRYIAHPQGAKWGGTPANTAGGASNTELATAANWTLALNDYRNCGVVCLRTNG